MIKLIATDMDGTFLNEEGNRPEQFVPFYENLKSKNVLFAAASGRQLYNLQKCFEEVRDEMLFIAENGTYVVYKGKELFSNTLPKERAVELIHVGRKIKGAFPIFCGKKAAYIESTNQEFIKEVEKYYERYEIVPDLTKVSDEVLKITMCDFEGSESNSYPYFKNFEKELQVSVSGAIWLDITNLGANKGEAIKKVQDHLGISFQETMVFGDYLNDLEMMEAAYFSYAMANAHPKVKEIARFEAKSNQENGVISAIEEAVFSTI